MYSKVISEEKKTLKPSLRIKKSSRTVCIKTVTNDKKMNMKKKNKEINEY